MIAKKNAEPTTVGIKKPEILAAIIQRDFNIAVSPVPSRRRLGFRLPHFPKTYNLAPQRPVIEIAAGLCLLQELAGVENSIVSLKPYMRVDLPANIRA
ncbi:MAG: hypothetical protein WBX22_09470, partial [Silvibacterium sp.]